MKLLLMFLILLMLTRCAAPIGTVSGPERDCITVDGDEYIRVEDAPAAYDIYSGADRGSKLGVIKDGDETLHIYAVKGDTEQNYLYVRWEWEGYLYVRRTYTEEETEPAP